MIQANELRKGNKVISKTHNLLNATVDGFVPSGMVFLKEVTTYDWLKDLEPISLTVEVLESVGYVHPKGKDYFVHHKTLNKDLPELRIVKVLDVWLCSIGDNENGIGIGVYKSLHDFQNLHFALTGEELEISL